MKVHSDKKIQELKELRKQGYSIPRLVRELQIPKTTIWHHVHGIELTDSQKAKIRSQQGGSKLKFEREIQNAKQEANKLLNSLPLSESLPLILVALYWAEGTKRNDFSFTNTDEKMVRVFLKILRGFFRVPNEQIVALVRITSTMNSSKCFRYWQHVTSLPQENIKTDQSNKHNKSRTEHGICRIRVKRGGYLLKFISALINEITLKILNTRVE